MRKLAVISLKSGNGRAKADDTFKFVFLLKITFQAKIDYFSNRVMTL